MFVESSPDSSAATVPIAAPVPPESHKSTINADDTSVSRLCERFRFLVVERLVDWEFGDLLLLEELGDLRLLEELVDWEE